MSALLDGMKQAQKQLAETNPEAAAALGKMTGVSQGQAAQRRVTKELLEYETAQKEIDRMKKESAQYENPDDFAKFGKMQRQILKLEKELKKLKEKAD